MVKCRQIYISKGYKEPHLDPIKDFLSFKDPGLGVEYSDHMGLWAVSLGERCRRKSGPDIW